MSSNPSPACKMDIGRNNLLQKSNSLNVKDAKEERDGTLKEKISGCFEIRRDCDSGTACVNASLPEIVLQSVEKKNWKKSDITIPGLITSKSPWERKST